MSHFQNWKTTPSFFKIDLALFQLEDNLAFLKFEKNLPFFKLEDYLTIFQIGRQPNF